METVYVPRRTMLSRNEEAVEEEKRRLGTFVLISNAETDRVTNAEVLRTYKGQDAAETRFRLVKDPQLVDGIFLKKPDRIGTLGIVLVMALLQNVKVMLLHDADRTERFLTDGQCRRTRSPCGGDGGI